VSSERQPERGAGLERQALPAACRRRGWRPLELLADAALAVHERNRPGVEQALRVLERGEANALVAAKRERLTEALGELAALLASAQQRGWALVALDCALETTTPPAAEASCERRLISERTRAALALARAQGVRLGRPPTMSQHAIERIGRERAAGRSLAAIAEGLNADRIPTAQGVAAGIQPPSSTRSTAQADPRPRRSLREVRHARETPLRFQPAWTSSRAPGVAIQSPRSARIARPTPFASTSFC